MSDLTPQSETPTPTTDKITQAARETIYLCNFRVSVDGEWLCLRELNDISLTPDPEPAHEGKWEVCCDPHQGVVCVLMGFWELYRRVTPAVNKLGKSLSIIGPLFSRHVCSEFYEPNALMMEEEGAVIAGLLVGLNVIDANLCMKGEDLDSQVGVIDFSMYLKDGGHSSKSAEGDGQITAILDQKNYVEELNRHLSASVNNLQAKVDALEKSNTKLTEELAVANNRIITLQEDVERVKEESSFHLESRKASSADGQTLAETRKQLKEETLLRLDVERELEVQIGMKQEMELSMKMLEKDVCEKQDALVELRQQLEDLRTINQQLGHKSQSSDASSKQKSEAIVRLEEKINQMSGTIKQLESSDKHLVKQARHLNSAAEKLLQLQP
uniref:RUN and FYVE domain containing 3 n=1 Tax=Nothobranchius furzeri TaxID=105023 RepID=A0A8C6KXH8_NOTFU